MSLPLPPSALRPQAAHTPPALRRSTSSALGGRASRAPPNWYHVDGNLAAKTRSNHPNGVVGVALGWCWSYEGSRAHAGSSPAPQIRETAPRLVRRGWGSEGRPAHTQLPNTMWQGSKLDELVSVVPTPYAGPSSRCATGSPPRRTSPQVRPPSHVQACHSCNFVLAC